jgi:hypothetical protein
MRRSLGFALIAVLWTVTALTAIVGLAVGAARLGQETSFNRLALTRGRWAAEACLAIVQARWVQHRLADSGSEGLGRDARCAWRLSDPTARLNVNVADPGELAAVVCSRRGTACGVDSLIARRRAGAFTDLEQVARVAGVDPGALPLLTVDGPGSVNVNAAPPAVLLAFPGLTHEAVARIEERRALGRPIPNLDALAADLSPDARSVLLAHYADLARQLTFGPPVLLCTTRGWVEGIGAVDRLDATIEVLVVPLPDRLAVVRRRMS